MVTVSPFKAYTTAGVGQELAKQRAKSTQIKLFKIFPRSVTFTIIRDRMAMVIINKWVKQKSGLSVVKANF